MAGELLCTYESENAVVRIYTGPMSDTPEKLQATFTKAAIPFEREIQKQKKEVSG